jgi:phosphonate transport system ATP-binding protein
MAAFALEGVTVRFGPVTALTGISLSIAPGSHAAIVGPSGSGKSTLLRLLNGAVLPAEGSVRVEGAELTSLSSAALRRLRAHTGFIHQQGALVPNMRVAANLACGRLGHCGFFGGLRRVVLPSRTEKAEMHRLLARVGMAERLHSRVDQLSGGQQQRVAIARALWQQPRALLADEPVSSLDPARARAVLALLTGLCQEDGLTLLASLHQFDLAREFFPRLVGLRGGRVVFDKPSQEVGEAEYRALYDLSGAELEPAAA